MSLNGCLLNPGSACMYYKPWDSKAAFTDVSQMHRRNMVSFPLCSRTRNHKPVSISSKGIKALCHSYTSKAFSRGEPGGLLHTALTFPGMAELIGVPQTTAILPNRVEGGALTHTIPQLPRRNQLYYSKRASKGISCSHRYATTTEKPKWWWRTLACVLYVSPFHAPWLNIETLYQMHPLLEHIDFLTCHPYLRAYERLPGLFLLAFINALTFGVLKRKECPHFLRFHVAMAMILGSSMDVIGIISKFMPCEVFFGKTGLLFWSAVAFAYLFTVLDCARCAMAGKYPEIPIYTDAALLNIQYR